MEGYLLKWVNYLWGWRRRYFILHNGVLHYCQDKGQVHKGAIHLNVAEIAHHSKNPRRLVIDTGCTIIHLKAASPEEAKMWVTVLKTAKGLLLEEETIKEGSSLATGSEEEDLMVQALGQLATLQAGLEEDLDEIGRSTDPLFSRAVQRSKDLKVFIHVVRSFRSVSSAAE
jgi:hypothetical protein